MAHAVAVMISNLALEQHAADEERRRACSTVKLRITLRRSFHFKFQLLFHDANHISLLHNGASFKVPRHDSTALEKVVRFICQEWQDRLAQGIRDFKGRYYTPPETEVAGGKEDGYMSDGKGQLCASALPMNQILARCNGRILTVRRFDLPAATLGCPPTFMKTVEENILVTLEGLQFLTVVEPMQVPQETPLEVYGTW